LENLSENEIRIEPMVYAYAGFWRRYAASLLDGIIVGLIGAALGFGVGFLWITQIGDDELSRNILSAILNVAIFIISWFYFAVQESSETQATIGKRLMGIFVTDLQGNQISFGRATGRYFGKILSGMIFMIGYILAGFTNKKQALHDLMAGTLVIHAHS
jgi:uncharacterized RDD family membrane protein YckC